MTPRASTSGSKQTAEGACVRASVNLWVLCHWCVGKCPSSVHFSLYIGSKRVHTFSLPSARRTPVRPPLEGLHQLAPGLSLNPGISTLKFLSQGLHCVSATSSALCLPQGLQGKSSPSQTVLCGHPATTPREVFPTWLRSTGLCVWGGRWRQVGEASTRAACGMCLPRFLTHAIRDGVAVS